MKWYVILIDALVGLPILGFLIWSYITDKDARWVLNLIIFIAVLFGLITGLAALNGARL